MPSSHDRPPRDSARRTWNQAPGWVDWNPSRDVPNWTGGRVTLDGRFSADELLAILALARHAQ
ncbi:hypothetical protein AB4851_08965 [Burkholderia sp. 22PA0099]|uniref:hypothetical protein n=1 Tax=Burkholderia sp. 22PA0099 TaxID=3237372 RepID=UPI0039C3B9DF